MHANKLNTPILHVGSSDKNPVTIRKCTDAIMAYWRAHPPEKKLGRANFIMYNNMKVYNTVRFF